MFTPSFSLAHAALSGNQKVLTPKIDILLYLPVA